MKEAFIPRRAKCWTWHERWQMTAIGLASVYEGLVQALSLGYLTVDTRSWLLFDVFED